MFAEKNKGRVYEPPIDYAFRSKITCGCCGKGYVHKINNSGKAWAKPIWRCLTANKHGLAVCAGKGIYDAVIEPLFTEAYNSFVAHRAEYQSDTELMVKKSNLLAEERQLKTLSIKGMIAPDRYKAENAAIITAIEKIDAEIKKAAMSDVCGKSAKPIFEFDGDKVREYLERAVIKDGTVTFEFINGYTMTKPYSNGQSGNKKGWKERRTN